MWVHLVIFIVAAGSAFAWKAGWLKLDGLADRESVRWFLIVAVCGNLVGMLLTVRRHIVGGANRTLFSVDLPPRLCRTGT